MIIYMGSMAALEFGLIRVQEFHGWLSGRSRISFVRFLLLVNGFPLLLALCFIDIYLLFTPSYDYVDSGLDSKMNLLIPMYKHLYRLASS